jgi:soluble lytic murein transglycosylase-like protein
MTGKRKLIHRQNAHLTPKSDTTAATAQVDDSARLREIRTLVEANNKSGLDKNLIVCQIYMESRFDSNASAIGSSARGLMQLLKAPVRELYRIKNNELPHTARQPESTLYAQADHFHNSPQFIDEATNISTGTEYLGLLVKNATNNGEPDPVAKAYIKYRGITNGIYYRKIKSCADRLKADPENMQILRDMVK